MAQTGYTPISLYYSATGAAVPTAGNLVAGELALNTNDGKLYYKNSSGVVTLLAGATAGPAGGSTTQIQYNNAGALAGNGAMTFNSGTSTITLTTLNLTNALGVAYGGTGLTAGTSGGVLAYTATGTLASSAALAANALVIGGGAGAAPSTTTTGTGVVTALGVNTSTAGAFVVNGGALGTPSSGTVTNLTGTASININGTVGATTPTTGAFTTLSATGTGAFLLGSGATTAARYAQIINNGSVNGVLFGTEGTTAGGILTGSSSYSGIISQTGNLDLALGTFGVARLIITGAGAASFSNGLAVTGTLSATGTLSGGTSGTGYSFSGSAPATSLTLDASGNLGIGTSSPSTALDVASSNSGITLTNTAVSNKKWRLGGSSAAAFQITEAGVADRFTIDTSGNITTYGTISVGNVTPSTSGAGITFPATQSASTNANTLDDYEEGTWTPSVGGTATYSVQSGVYTKIGRLVEVSFAMGIALVGTGSTTTISGLPFPQIAAAQRSTGAVGYYLSLAVNVLSVVSVIDVATTNIFFSGSTTASANITDSLAIFGNGANVYSSITYTA